MTTEHVHIIVIVPLEEELLSFLEEFPSIKNKSTETSLRHIVYSPRSDVNILVVQQEEMGKSSAAKAASDVLNDYTANLIVCIGIAGGLSSDLRLGDVCYSGGIVDVYDNTKVTDAGGEATDTELSPTHYASPKDLTAAMNFARTQPELRPSYQEWCEERTKSALAMVPNEVPTRDGSKEKLLSPTTLGGVLACGAVSKSDAYNKKLRQIERKILAIETESGGVFEIARQHSIDALTIRGISDYADKSKGELEKDNRGSVRSLAASNAISFLKFQIGNNPYFVRAVHRRSVLQLGMPLTIETKSAPSILASYLSELAKLTDETLRKLSPEYKLQPQGYRLPLPRVRQIQDSGDVVPKDVARPIDVREAIAQHNKIFIHLPRTYPDQSLAWVIADDLITGVIDGKQTLPIVIDGQSVRGKRTTFESVAPIDLTTIINADGVQVIFIVEDIPWNSNHRINLLIEEIEKYSSAKFIFIARNDTNLVPATEFQTRTAAIPYKICPISFVEIAHFIQKNFSMTGAESEVLALKLRNTFDAFSLDAHPTYFAGIPRETLAALLHANKRSELIQLAVDGFLTFIVAGDQEDISLSRSTRARFLKQLVVEMRLEKRSFDQAQLVHYTKEFADQYDFDINPLAFIKAFVDQGILHFDGGRAQISLPFIEAYLLASELSSSPNNAQRYFQVDDDEFDLATFDLYSEIGASRSLIDQIVDQLSRSLDILKSTYGDDHILLTEEISPSNLRRPERAEALKRRLKSAAQAVRDNTDKSREKQQMLDLSERVREESGKQLENIKEDETKNGDGEKRNVPPLVLASEEWMIATVLLGSGAEHLDAITKRKLCSLIVKVAAKIIDGWSRYQQKFDFDVVRKALTTSEAVAEFPGDQTVDEKRKFVDGVLDLLEYAALADPLRRVVGHLCEQSQHRVLATSIENAETDDIMEEMIRSTWLSDIDSKKGHAALREATKRLPSATFFRITLASHYLSRVYWSQWRREDRLTLLDAAEEIIKPLEVKLNKSEIKRIVENSTRSPETDGE